jgi:hypothetical protein
MKWDDYWIVKYRTEESKIKRHILYISAPYDQYDEEKIRKILADTNPEWEIVKVYPVEKLNFRRPSGG